MALNILSCIIHIVSIAVILALPTWTIIRIIRHRQKYKSHGVPVVLVIALLPFVMAIEMWAMLGLSLKAIFGIVRTSFSKE